MAKRILKDIVINYYSFDLRGLPVDVLKTGIHSGKLKDLILIVPGNPGLVEYYSTFIKQLHKELDESVEVWALSHSCHSIQSSNNVASLHDKLCTGADGSDRLEIEIEHKLRFLEQMVPADCNITLVGHSIGCFMILSLMEIISGKRNRPKFAYPNTHSFDTIPPSFSNPQLFSQINKCVFLFPTVERMKVSPNGRKLWPLLKYMRWFLVSLVTIINWFPLSLKEKIATWVLARKNLDNDMIKPTVDLLTPRIFGNMLHLAYDELKTVKSLHKESVKLFKDKLVFYFAVRDGWCPLSYRNELVEDIPTVTNYVDVHNVDHAFVISHSHLMASVLAKLLRSKSLN